MNRRMPGGATGVVVIWRVREKRKLLLPLEVGVVMDVGGGANELEC